MRFTNFEILLSSILNKNLKKSRSGATHVVKKAGRNLGKTLYLPRPPGKNLLSCETFFKLA